MTNVDWHFYTPRSLGIPGNPWDPRCQEPLQPAGPSRFHRAAAGGPTAAGATGAAGAGAGQRPLGGAELLVKDGDFDGFSMDFRWIFDGF